MMFRAFIIGFGLSSLSSFCYAQDPSKTIDFEEVRVRDNRIFKRVGLYDSYEADNSKNINGFTQLNIFNSTMSDEIWVTESKKCVHLDFIEETNDTLLRLVWNKDQLDCDWVGMGFGWDYWTSKDMSGIIDLAAVEFEVRSTDKEITNLPWAMGFEDYTGGQAWLGFTQKFFLEGKITKNWSKVQIPLSLFPFEENNIDLSNIKQIIVQLFAEGTIEINRIELVPFSGKLREELVSIRKKDLGIVLDGSVREWSTKFISFGNGHSFSSVYTPDTLYLAVDVNDDSPRMNNKSKGELWNGDAIEIAFSTNPKANPKRSLFLLSDYHLGLNCGEQPYFWNFSEDKPFPAGRYSFGTTDRGYSVEIAIPLSQFMERPLSSNLSLGFEIAVDDGNEKFIRVKQDRWNSSGSEGFHLNPSMWGTLTFE